MKAYPSSPEDQESPEPLTFAPGSVTCLLIRHTPGCPATASQRESDCTCESPGIEFVTRRTFVREMRTTAQRVADARRQAEAAIRKAARKAQKEARKRQRGSK